MLQLGWFKHCAKVTVSSSLRFLPRKGPPLAVMSKRFTSSSLPPCKAWKIALCSLSTGVRLTLFLATASITRLPAATKVSLLARAIFLPQLIAAIVGRKPA